MNMKEMKQNLRRIGRSYGLIVMAVNLISFFIVSKQTIMVNQNESFFIWIQFVDKHNQLINGLSVLSFVIPIVLCILYVATAKKENVEGRIINIPLVYAVIGSMGWFLTMVFELCAFLYVALTTGYNMHSVAMSSFLSIFQCCIFVTTIVFMCLTTIHRIVVLPKVFPEGNLSRYEKRKKISVSFLMLFFYFSVAIFPIFYLISVLRNYSLSENFHIDNTVYYMVAGLIFLGIILLLTVSWHFSTPLKKLKSLADEIKNHKYGKKTDIVSNDDFGDLADTFNSMSYSLLEKSQRIVSIQNSIIRGMAVMVESRDNSTGGHINRTSECVKVFVGKMKNDARFDISDSFEQAIIKAAPMHDLGKIAVDDAILRKPARFTDEEFEVMKTHAEKGAVIVEEVLRESDDEEFKKIAVNVAHYHHEKWDGSGYPTHIKGEDIPYEARIMALADVFDALVSKRCYKESMSYDEAFSIIEKSLGQHFDPVLGAFFISCRKELEDLYNNLPE